MDSIKLEKIEFFGYHGVLESEKNLGQMFSVDCEIFLETTLCFDDIGKTVNYGDLALDIKKFCEKTRFDLLESLANHLAKMILRKYLLVKYVSLSINKPHAPIPTKFSNVSLNISRKRVYAYLAIGSNLGDRESYLNMVFDEIEKNEDIVEIRKSSFIETEPYGVKDQPNFLNGVIKIETILTPYELLDFCKQVESLAGRNTTRRWGERTLDVDIIAYGNTFIFEEDLKIPHAEMHMRDFVLKPLEEIEPYFIHPIYKKNIKDMLLDIKCKTLI